MKPVSIEIKVDEDHLRKILPEGTEDKVISDFLEFLSIHLPIVLEAETASFINFILFGESTDDKQKDQDDEQGNS